MKGFCVADLDARGELLAQEHYDYATLERVSGCSELIGHLSGQLYRSPTEFETSLPDTGGALILRWYGVSETAGIASVRHEDELAALSLLASGLDPRADELTLEAFQRRLVYLLHDTGYEPCFDLLGIAERPLVATVNFTSGRDDVLRLVLALADRCFAAAFFRYHHLA